jgi:uncharacterized membrane-anchored protein
MKKFILTLYYRLFYWFFRFNKKQASGAEETDKEASILAVMLLSGVMFLFVFSLLFAVSLFVIRLPKPSSLFIYAVGIVIVVFNGFFFFSYKRYLMIKKRFENEDKRTRIVRSLLCFLFVFISMFAMGILGVLFGNPFLEQ